MSVNPYSRCSWHARGSRRSAGPHEGSRRARRRPRTRRSAPRREAADPTPARPDCCRPSSGARRPSGTARCARSPRHPNSSSRRTRPSRPCRMPPATRSMLFIARSVGDSYSEPNRPPPTSRRARAAPPSAGRLPSALSRSPRSSRYSMRRLRKKNGCRRPRPVAAPRSGHAWPSRRRRCGAWRLGTAPTPPRTGWSRCAPCTQRSTRRLCPTVARSKRSLLVDHHCLHCCWSASLASGRRTRPRPPRRPRSRKPAK